LAPLVDDAIVQEHHDHMPVIFIQHANDVPQGELVVYEQVADSYLSLGFRVQVYTVGRNLKLSSDREAILRNGLVISHKRWSLLSGDIRAKAKARNFLIPGSEGDTTPPAGRGEDHESVGRSRQRKRIDTPITGKDFVIPLPDLPPGKKMARSWPKSKGS
jgi:hypothetical protein